MKFLIKKTINKLIKKKLKISVAESCTGGMLSSAITSVPGSSKIFVLGVVCYSNQSKISLLKVPKKIISKHGAVSYQACLSMVKNLNKSSKTDISVSVTGIAGPSGGKEDKPVGLVYVGYCSSNISKVEKFNFHSNRQSNKLRTSQAVLDLIMKNIE